MIWRRYVEALKDPTAHPDRLLCVIGFHDFGSSGHRRLDCPIDPGICERCWRCGHHAFNRHNSEQKGK